MLGKYSIATLLPIFISICFLVIAQLLLKYGMNLVGKIELTNLDQLASLVIKVFITPPLLLGVVLYIVSSFFWLVGLSKIELSVAYPFVGLAYVLVALFSAIFLGETVTLVRWAGIFLILAGVILVSRT
jgi:multidrug transporter EmrE-like cation transporter